MATSKAELNYKFANGVTITGTLDQILQYATLVKEVVQFANFDAVPRGYYESDTKGLVKISEMNTFHIVNALNKATVQYYTRLKPDPTTFNLAQYLKDFVGLANNPVIEDFYSELVRRPE